MGNNLRDIIKKPTLLFMTLGHRGLFNWISDERYLKIAYKIKMGKTLNLDHPQTFNEKLQWLKLHDRRSEYTMMVDKHEVKEYVAETIGKNYVIPTIGIWDHFNQINFDTLPNQFVLKCTHDSGGLVICKDKNTLNKVSAEKKIEQCLKHNFFWGQREWPYKNVKPRIIAEPYLENSKGDLRDYKFFTFNGKVKALFIASQRWNKDETRFDFFDAKGEFLPFTNGHPNADSKPELPVCFDEMKQLAAKLADRIPEVRVDFYEINGKVYFGEMTFFHWSGMKPFVPEEWDYIFGSWIDIDSIRKE